MLESDRICLTRAYTFQWVSFLKSRLLRNDNGIYSLLRESVVVAKIVQRCSIDLGLVFSRLLFLFSVKNIKYMYSYIRLFFLLHTSRTRYSLWVIDASRQQELSNRICFHINLLFLLRQWRWVDVVVVGKLSGNGYEWKTQIHTSIVITHNEKTNKSIFSATTR